MNMYGGLLWWLSGKESVCQCSRDEFSPDRERSCRPQSNYACAPQLLSLCARTQELRRLSPGPQSHDPGMELGSPALQADAVPPGKLTEQGNFLS